MSIAGRVARNPIGYGILAVVLLFLVFSSVSVVKETDQAVVVRFGDPQRIINRYEPGEGFGNTAGLMFHWPFVDRVVWIDRRIQNVEMERQQVLSTDQLRLQVDAFARYRIVDPLQMYISAGTEERVSEALRPILASSLRNELGRRPFAALLSPERGEVMDNIQQSLNLAARQYGAEIVDVRIKRADLPEGQPLESAYERMRSARRQEALTIRAQGAKQAQIIRAEADAEAAATYAEAFGADPDFYDFYRAMESYRTTFGIDRDDPNQGEASIVMSPQNEYLRQFRGQR
ncbi:MAG: protease modulator HflC [Parasphingopyxis sp.]|uniref:protease modulator HflC n=1 Tax=Parasphingopyxis sp. TaxID=1920299 RepID=UPI00262DDD23|nr:protease modulator HflC [uncultured Parasphingopyxis sp.]